MLINVLLGGKTVFDAKGVPSVVGGTPAIMDTDELELRTSKIDNETEQTEITEYWLDGELVHRSVNMRLKQAIFAKGLQGKF